MTVFLHIIASSLTVEVILCAIISICPPSVTHKIISSRLFVSIRDWLRIVFFAYFVLLSFLFADSLFDLRKYQQIHQYVYLPTANEHSTLTAKMNLFRSQRNFYLSGFSLYFIFLLYRISKLISSYAVLIVSNDAVMKQATNASKQYITLFDQKDNSIKTGDENEAQSELANLKTENDSLSTRLKVLKEEHDILLKDYAALQEKLQKPDDKKKN